MSYYHRPQGQFGSAIWSVTEDRDVSRAAAERHFLLQSLPEPRRAAQRPGSRWSRISAFAGRARRADA